MKDLLDEAWHAMFHLIDAFDPVAGDRANRQFTDYQKEAMAEAKRVMEKLQEDDQ